MKIRNLTFDNLRIFSGQHAINFDPERNVTVLLGNNGAGKTTILTAIQLLLSEFTNAFPGNSRKNFILDDVHLDNGGRPAERLSAELSLSVQNRDEDIRVAKYVVGTGDKNKTPKGETKEIFDYASELKNKYLAGEETVFPPVMYYSTERGHIKAPERKRNFQKSFENYDTYTGALDAEANFSRFFEWFDLQEEMERRERLDLTEHASTPEEYAVANTHQSKVLQVIRQALPMMLDGRFKNPRIMMQPTRFVVDEILEDGSKRELRLERLSDGYRILIAMICDLLGRMAEANPKKSVEEILKVPGVVLIDEIELHLHPSIQRQIISKLHTMCPEIQFIVTTHSPLVALSAMDVAQVLILDEKGGINDAVEEDCYVNYDINQVLLSPLFSIPSVRAAKWDPDLSKRSQLLSQQILTDQEKKQLAELNERILDLNVTHCEHLPEVSKLLKELARKV